MQDRYFDETNEKSGSYCRKSISYIILYFLILARKIKKAHSEKISYISGNGI